MIVIVETWIKTEAEAQSIQLPNYTHHYNYRRGKRGGGVSIFVHKNLKHNYIHDFCEDDNHFLWVHLDRFSIDIGAVYKPERTNDPNFLETYSQQLLKRKRAMILGDFNYDLLKRSRQTTVYKQMLKETGFVLLNKIDPEYCTRETDHSKTILDHVCSNIKNNTFHLAIVETTISDHKQIYFEIHQLQPENKLKIEYQSINYNKLPEELNIMKLGECNGDYDKLEKMLLEAVNKCKITKTKILNPLNKDWINKDVIKAINTRNKLGYNYIRRPNDETAKEEYFTEKRRVQRYIQETKSSHYLKLFEHCVSKPRKMWQLINNLNNKKVKTHTAPAKLVTCTGEITEIADICNHFNSFFANIGSTLAAQIPSSNHTPILNAEKSQSVLFSFNPVLPDEISKIIDNLNPNTSSGLDGITCKVIKSIKLCILDELTKCINECLLRGFFPDSLKIAKVSPIFKSGNRTDAGNYRPISVLPVISKVFEKVIYTQLERYLHSIDFLFNKQYGFRPKSNTLSACIDLTTKIKTEIDHKKIALGIFIDLKKAFDTISHKLLLQKLHSIGVRGTVYKMLQSYLTNRYQIVKIDNIQSSAETIIYGVPQGSILGPLLFLIYVNDIGELGICADISLYADDTCLFYFGDDIASMARVAQKDLNSLFAWFQCNLLTLNIAKTNYIIFSAKNKQISQFDPLTINGEPLNQVKSEKYLGLTLDSRLTWKPHIKKTRSKLTSLMSILRGNVRCFPLSVRYTIYNTLVKPHLDYLIEVYGSAPKTNMKKLQTSQNKLIKLLFHFHYLTPTTEIYKKTGLMSLAQIYKYNTCVLVHKILKKSIHTHISFKIKSQTQKRSLRRPYDIQLPSPRTNYGKKNITYEGAQLFNKLPNDIKRTESLFSFKKKLKHYITKHFSEFS